MLRLRTLPDLLLANPYCAAATVAFALWKVALTGRSPTCAKREGRMCVWAICDNNPHLISDISKDDCEQCLTIG